MKNYPHVHRGNKYLIGSIFHSFIQSFNYLYTHTI
ncbi:hypothetical protein T01_10149 [Trichinella spiralis]|uniref:Uncharacterized protein n=1 Tax=Trichinella spiralis TaxID=6334 RepID=A0A0V0YZK5_TRISP|nr:hypothetical protein T01_10149 [Trichinella spiralis]